MVFLLKMFIFENRDGFFGVGPIVYALDMALRSLAEFVRVGPIGVAGVSTGTART